MSKQITTDGVDYVSALSHSPVRIVVLQRGWVVVGRYHVRDDGQVEVTDASVVRRWGTTKGLGELRSGPTSNTVLDPCGRVEAHPLSVVLTLEVDADAWIEHL